MNEFLEWEKIFCLNKRYMKDKDYCLFLRAVNEGSFQFVEIGILMNEVVKFVSSSCVLDVIDDSLQDIDSESTRSQLLIKCQMDDSLKNGDHCSKLVGV
jgi:hypothetical protein